MPDKPGPIPENEAEKVFHLTESDIDYSNVENDFKGLALSAAKIAVKDQTVITDVFNLLIFKDKLEQLYLPQAKNKGINFLVKTSKKTEHISFSKNKLLQIAGNLIYNAIKFTPENGTIEAELELTPLANHNLLKIKVIDTGVGMDETTIAMIMEGATPSSNGTHGETGFGFGLSLVKRLIETLDGEFKVSSDEDNGATFEILIRQTYQ
jgi:signal transduction histidine kinase